MRRRTPPALIAAAAVAALLVALAAPARPVQAHALAVSSDPAPNAKLTASPRQITVEFSEPIEPSVTTVQLWDQSGKQIALPKPRFFADDPKRMAVDVTTTLPPGIYTVIWRNLSKVDGHTWPGSFPFIVLLPNGQVPAGAPAAVAPPGAGASNTPSTLDTTARWSVLLAISVIVGGILFALGVMRPCLRYLSPGAADRAWTASRAVLLASSATACLFVAEGTLLQIALKAQDFGGLHAAGTLLLDTRLGNYLLARLGLTAVALALVAVAARAPSPRGTTAALAGVLVAAAGLLLTHALVSHAASGDGAVTGVAIDFFHLSAAAIWVGAVVHIAFTLPRWLELLRAGSRTVFLAYVFRRFSGLATFSVGLLLASGVLSASLQAPAWSALVDTNWGRALDVKLGLTLVLLAVGGVNAWLLRPRVVDAVLEEHSAPEVVRTPGLGGSTAMRALHGRLLTMVRVEAVLGAVVLAAAAALIQLQAPRDAALAAAYGRAAQGAAATKDYTQTRELGAMQMFFDVSPARVGQNDFTVGLGAEFGNPPQVLQARLQFDHLGAATAGQSRLLLTNASISSGQVLYKGSGANLSLPGRWRVTANLRVEGRDDITQQFDLTIPGAGDAPAAPAATSIWNWPLRSRFAVAAMAVIAVAAVLGAGWQMWGRRALRGRRG